MVGRIQRPLSVRVRHEGVPADVVIDEIWDLLGRPSRIYQCIQVINKNITDIQLATHAQVENICSHSGIIMKGRRVDFERAGRNITVIYVKLLPTELSDSYISSLLVPYGTVVNMKREQKKMSQWTTDSGTRIVTIDMQKPVPNLMKFGAYEGMCLYRGVDKICRKCRNVGHLQFDCHKYRCTNCFSMEHVLELCQKNCALCGSSEHKRPGCTKATWASKVAGNTVEEAIEIDETTVAEEPITAVTEIREISVPEEPITASTEAREICVPERMEITEELIPVPEEFPPLPAKEPPVQGATEVTPSVTENAEPTLAAPEINPATEDLDGEPEERSVEESVQIMLSDGEYEGEFENKFVPESVEDRSGFFRGNYSTPSGENKRKNSFEGSQLSDTSERDSDQEARLENMVDPSTAYRKDYSMTNEENKRKKTNKRNKSKTRGNGKKAKTQTVTAPEGRRKNKFSSEDSD